jgi:hypothetical protein
MTTKQLTTAIISSIKAATDGDGNTANDDASTPKKVNTQAGNSFGAKKGQIEVKLSDLRWQLIALLQEERCHAIVMYHR